MATAKTFSELASELKRVRTEIMEKEVADKATELMEENIEKEVYQAYTPMSDNSRTGELGRSVEADMSGEDTLVLYNSRMDTGFGGEFRNVAGIVETGRGYNWSGSLDEKIGARPFINATRQDLKNGEFKKIMIDGLRQRGINAE